MAADGCQERGSNPAGFAGLVRQYLEDVVRFAGDRASAALIGLIRKRSQTSQRCLT